MENSRITMEEKRKKKQDCTMMLLLLFSFLCCCCYKGKGREGRREGGVGRLERIVQYNAST
jgi:hypothetical protein